MMDRFGALASEMTYFHAASHIKATLMEIPNDGEIHIQDDRVECSDIGGHVCATGRDQRRDLGIHQQRCVLLQRLPYRASPRDLRTPRVTALLGEVRRMSHRQAFGLQGGCRQEHAREPSRGDAGGL